MTYRDHMTEQYDSEFKAVKSHGLHWYPWVGKEYHKTGIFVVGMSTDQRHGKDWTQELENPCDASRILAAWGFRRDDLFQFDGDGISFKKNGAYFYG